MIKTFVLSQKIIKLCGKSLKRRQIKDRYINRKIHENTFYRTVLCRNTQTKTLKIFTRFIQLIKFNHMFILTMFTTQTINVKQLKIM